MANTSIYKAFERMWAHVVNALSGKANTTDLDSLSEEVDGCITGLSVSGKTVTYTKNDGTTGTITTQDTKVNQAYSASTSAFPLLMSATSGVSSTGSRGDSNTILNNSIYAIPGSGKIYATSFSGSLAGNASSATKATKDASGNVITDTYETKTDATAKLTEAKSYSDTNLATAKTYADSAATTAANTVKDDLLNGAGTAYDTLKELGDLIDDNVDAIDALTTVAAGKMNMSNPQGGGAITLNPKSGSTIGSYSVSLGANNTASGNISVAIGYDNTASGQCSFAMGVSGVAKGELASSRGYQTIANAGQTVDGSLNIENTNSSYLYILGNGNPNGSVRSNAHTVDWSGNAWYAGNVYAGGTSQIDAAPLTAVQICTWEADD